MGVYFNYSTHIAEGYWARRSFLHQWWSLFSQDRRWTPPLYSWLYAVLVRNSAAHLRRCWLSPIHLEAAVKRRLGGVSYGGPLMLALDEECVAACVIIVDPRVDDGTAYLALLHCANDHEPLERLLDAAWERAAERGVVRLMGPTGLALRWGAGLLLDHFDRPPPLHVPYHPPYTHEIFELVMTPYTASRLYQLRVSAGLPEELDPSVCSTMNHCRCVPLNAAQLAGDLLPLVQQVYEGDDFPTPDALEIDFLLRSWQIAPLMGWILLCDDEAVGFILFQPDRGARLRRACGGRFWWRRPLLHVGEDRAGCVLMGGVAPQWRGHGLGRALLAQAIASAASLGWRLLFFGPVVHAGAVALLESAGAEPVHSYTLFVDDSLGGANAHDSWALY